MVLGKELGTVVEIRLTQEAREHIRNNGGDVTVRLVPIG